MILTGDIDTHVIHSLNGLGTLVDQSGHWVSPLDWRAGIRGLGDLGVIPLAPGLHGMGCGCGGASPDCQGDGGYVAPDASLQSGAPPAKSSGNSILDCSCRCGPGQTDQAVMEAFSALAGGRGLGLGAFDLSLSGSMLAGVVPHAWGLPVIPNWVVYAGLALLVLPGMMGAGGGGRAKR